MSHAMTNQPRGAQLDPRIGILSSGRYYCYPNGHHQPEVIGSLADVEAALGLPVSAPQPVSEVPPATRSTQPAAREGTPHKQRAPRASKPPKQLWDVCLRYKYPGWCDVDGLWFRGIIATSKREANNIARDTARNDGHLDSMSGPHWFTAYKHEE